MKNQAPCRTLESCIRKAMLLEKQNIPKNLLVYDLMLNLPTEEIDIHSEILKTQQELASDLSLEERKYIEAKRFVLDLMKNFSEKN